MHCIPGKSSRTTCLKCNTRGQITGYKSPMVDMACPECGAAWRTISAICERCRTPSGNPHYSQCAICAKKTKRGNTNEQTNRSHSRKQKRKAT